MKPPKYVALALSPSHTDKAVVVSMMPDLVKHAVQAWVMLNAVVVQLLASLSRTLYVPTGKAFDVKAPNVASVPSEAFVAVFTKVNAPVPAVILNLEKKLVRAMLQLSRKPEY